MSERDMLRRPAPPPRITALPYGPWRRIGTYRGKTVREKFPVQSSWTDDDGYRLGQWRDGRVFRYMETVW